MRTFVLAHSTARAGAADACRTAPDGYVVSIKEPSRNLDQNAKLHAELTDIARTKEWAGKKWSVEDWKRLATAAWMRATGRTVTMLPALDGQGFDVLYQRTSKLTKAECSELLEWLIAWKNGGDA